MGERKDISFTSKNALSLKLVSKRHDGAYSSSIMLNLLLDFFVDYFRISNTDYIIFACLFF